MITCSRKLWDVLGAKGWSMDPDAPLLQLQAQGRPKEGLPARVWAPLAWMGIGELQNE